MDSSINLLSLNGCRAIKQGDINRATELLNEALTSEDKILLDATRNMFQMAVRRHHIDVLDSWIEILMPRLREILLRDDLFSEAKDFLEALVFSVCDHRLHNMFKKVGELVIILDDSCKDPWQLKDFLIELSSLSARMSLRKWNEEAIWLNFLVMDSAVNRKDIKFLDAILFQVDLNSIMYAKNFGLDAMLELYKQVQFTYIYLLNSCASKEMNHEEIVACTRLALRNERNLMTNLARVTMQEEYEVYQNWFKNMWRQFSDSDVLQTFSVFLVRMTVEYWRRTKPKSSCNQIPLLANIAEPKSLCGIYKEILDEIT